MRTVVRLAVALVVLAGGPPATPAGAPEGLEAWMLGPFVRHADPVLVPRKDALFHCPLRNADVRWEAKDVFNPAAVVREGKVHLLYRAQDDVGRPAGTSRIALAVSTDGFAFERPSEPVLFPDDDFMMPFEWEGGCEDPRVVESEDGTYVMTYTAFDGTTARLAVATSRDLVHWTKHGLAFGKAAGGRFRDLWSKSGAVVATLQASGRIVAARIDGKYWMYWGDTDIFAASSDNLVDWTPIERDRPTAGKVAPPGAGTCFKVVVPTRRGRFDSALVEPGPPPLVDSRGILFLHNAKNDRPNGDGTLADGAYAAGQLLLDPADPTVVLARATAPFFRPESAAETAGQVPNVTFLEGLVFFRERWLLYYGMADSRIGMAEYQPASSRVSDAGTRCFTCR
jgi:beta-1,2-mannosidase